MEKESTICIKSRAVTGIIHSQRIGKSRKRSFGQITEIEIFVNISDSCPVRNMRTHHKGTGFG